MRPPVTTPGNHRKAPVRLVMITAVIGALLILVVSVVLNWQSAEPGGHATVGGSGLIGSAPAPKVVFEAPAGSCLNWVEPDASDIRQVTCAEPHLFEVTGQSDLRAEFGTASFPDAAQWQEIKQQRCIDVSNQFLSGHFDPNGRFAVGAFTPSEEGWQDGDRTLHCGLQQPGPSGKLFANTGSVAKADQSNVHQAGRCLGINGTAVWDPVPCGQPHAVEVAAVVNLAEQFHDGFPKEEDQDGFLAAKCEELTAAYSGSPTAAKDKGLVVYWDTLTQVSWDAGSRQVNCKLSAQLPDGSGLAPVTGSVRDRVQIGKQPAPETPTSEQAGVPATEPR